MIPVRRVLVPLAMAWLASCRSGASVRAPAANLLVVAGDSTFWIANDTGAFDVRRSPILLAHYGGRFYEIYVTDDDRSFYDAVIVGQRIYRRDLIGGDSAAVFEDPTLAELAASYASAHPGQRPLAPDEDGADDPMMSSTTETDVVDVLGPFATFEQRADMDLPDGRELLHTSRSVVDLRSSRVIALGDLVTDSVRRRILRDEQRALAATFDSVRKSSDPRARVAARMLRGFIEDDSSFSLVLVDTGPAVAFLVPGQGERAGGYALPLPPIRIPAGEWWNEVRATLPSHRGPNEDAWAGPVYDVVVRYDSAADAALLTLRDASGKEFLAMPLPAPVTRVYRLDSLARDTLTINALRRAFDEAAPDASDTTRTITSIRPSGIMPVSNRIRRRPP